MIPMNENGPVMSPMQVDMEGVLSPEEIPGKMAKLFAEKQKQMAAEINDEELQELMADPEANMDKISVRYVTYTVNIITILITVQFTAFVLYILLINLILVLNSCHHHIPYFS